MGKKPFVLITGDDSVRAEGLILVKRVVEKFAEFQVVATLNQSSGAGGGITLKGGDWGREIVDGHEAIWVDGKPADAVFFAFDYLKRKPDLVISGINYGANLQNDSYISGTIGAALTAAQSYKIPTIAFSWDISSHNWQKDHDGSFDEKLLEYPGRLCEKIVRIAMKYKMPERNFWMVNFPEKPTDSIKIVKTNESGFFPNTQSIGESSYIYKGVIKRDGWEDGTDAGELCKGFATIAACKIEFTNSGELEKMKKLKIFEKLGD
jgi:5'-nucleotidase